jgi:hypothetical protein
MADITTMCTGCGRHRFNEDIHWNEECLFFGQCDDCAGTGELVDSCVYCGVHVDQEQSTPAGADPFAR